MDRVDPGRNRGADDSIDVKIAGGWRSRTKADHRVSKPGRQAVAVGVGHREHGLDAEHPAGEQGAYGVPALVGDEKAAQECHYRSAMIRISTVSCSANSALASRISATVPLTPAVTEFISFIVSMMQTTVSGPTRLPTATNGGAARLRGPEHVARRGPGPPAGRG